MDVTQTYLSLLIDTLQKKKSVLEQLKDITEQQKQLLQSENFEEDNFQKTLDKKDICIKELEKLDYGFEQVYERVALILKHNKDTYRNKIIKAQQLIQEVMDLAVSIRVLEEKNKERFLFCLSIKRGKMKNFKVSKHAVANYYRNMPNIHQAGQSYFLDKKK